ncbi:MAG: tyrosine-type recombinase/integrase [Eubacterium sp.]|jgi:site-specific recombinase XerD|nr:tyrosine-type recombinase/integrase [Eubacterium sp.]
MTNLKLNDIYPYYLKDFLAYMMTIKGRSNNTIISYHSDLKLFFKFLSKKKNPDNDFNDLDISGLDEAMVKSASLNTAMEFLYYMSAERGNSARARSRRAVAIRKFYKYLTDIKLWFNSSPMEKLELPSAKASLPKHLTVEQAIKILNSYSDLENIRNARDFCVLTFFLNCGMRLSELVGLNTNDIKIFNDLLTEEKVYSIKVFGKGSKERVIYMNSACISAYIKYNSHRNELVEKNKSLANEKALFLSKQLKRISNRRIQQIIEEALKANNLDNMGFSVHKLRHTAATLMYQNGVDVRALKEVLGHESLDTTQIYTHVANEQIKQAINNNPLASFIANSTKSNIK